MTETTFELPLLEVPEVLNFPVKLETETFEPCFELTSEVLFVEVRL